MPHTPPIPDNTSSGLIFKLCTHTNICHGATKRHAGEK
jgi:hypothetical protein